MGANWSTVSSNREGYSSGGNVKPAVVESDVPVERRIRLQAVLDVLNTLKEAMEKVETIIIKELL